jgi:hypothetical protein
MSDDRAERDDRIEPGGERWQRSTAPGAAAGEPEQTGGADAVPMTPADDGLAGRDHQGELEVEPPASS